MRRLTFVLLAVLAASCAAPPKPAPVAVDPQTAWKARRPDLAALTRWTATGRVLIKTEDQRWKATLQWIQRDGAYRIRLTAPMGQGTVQLSGDAARAVMQTSDKRMYSATDPETLMLDTLGWSVPVEGLSYWMRGLDDPSVPSAAHLDELGRLDNLYQSGWDIDYQGYREAPPLQLPSQLALANERLDVRILINRWVLNTP